MAVEVTADIKTLADFVEESERLRTELSHQLVDVAHLRHRVRVASSDFVVGSSSLDELHGLRARLDSTESLARRVRAELITADDPLAITVDGSSMFGSWSSHIEMVRQQRMATELVRLDERRRELRRLMRYRTATGHDASAELRSIEDRIAELVDGLGVIGWRHASYLQAGIDPEQWDTEQGLAHNDGIVQSVYRFYASLYQANSNLQWAGLAALVGPLFYAGFQDIHTLRLASDDGDRLAYLHQLIGGPRLPGIVYDALGLLAAAPIGHVTAGIQQIAANDLQWLERKLLAMQREIFDDMAWMHVAYLLGGVGAVSSLLPGKANEETRTAWQNVRSGGSPSLTDATEALARREQGRIIQDDYDDIVGLDPPVGHLLTAFMTWTAVSPVPGGRSYREVSNRKVTVTMPAPVVRRAGPFGLRSDLGRVDVPLLTLARGNIADFDDRWNWIENDMLPAFGRLVETDPDQLDAILRRSVAERADELRMSPLPYPR